MGLVVLLLPAAAGELTLGPEAMSSLAGLGVTSAVLVRDAETVGIVLEGWTFDEASAELAAAAVAGSATSHRTLRPLAQMAVSATAAKNRRNR